MNSGKGLNLSTSYETEMKKKNGKTNGELPFQRPEKGLKYISMDLRLMHIYPICNGSKLYVLQIFFHFLSMYHQVSFDIELLCLLQMFPICPSLKLLPNLDAIGFQG